MNYDSINDLLMMKTQDKAPPNGLFLYLETHIFEKY